MQQSIEPVIAPIKGGVRIGAGRPKGAKDRGQRLTRKVLIERLERLQRLGVLEGTARRVLEALGGDAYWVELMTRLQNEGEPGREAQVALALLQQRDGRPAQQITVTSIGVQFSADEIERARAVVRELVPAMPARLLPIGTPTSAVVDAECSPGVRGEEKEKA